jgi:hypothetical protein
MTQSTGLQPRRRALHSLINTRFSEVPAASHGGKPL